MSFSVGAELGFFQCLGWRLRVTKPHTLTVLYFGKVHEAEWLTEVQSSLPCLCGLVLLENDYILHPIYAVLYTYILYIYIYFFLDSAVRRCSRSISLISCLKAAVLAN